ncbi:MAG TPA: hypothetical protein VNB46_00540 [Gaiellaceae bacterium]|nr:hypothetical protein [Gaiellaceae bacterium]
MDDRRVELVCEPQCEAALARAARTVDRDDASLDPGGGSWGADRFDEAAER